MNPLFASHQNISVRHDISSMKCQELLAYDLTKYFIKIVKIIM